MTAFEIDDKEFARALPKPKIDGLICKPASSKQIVGTVSKIMKAQRGQREQREQIELIATE
jgi:hypothetical protein